MKDEQNSQSEATATEQRPDITMFDACLLHSRADRSLRSVVSKRLEKFDITMMEWLLLCAVDKSGKEGLTMSAAASTLAVTLPQVTSLSASLTKAKLLKQKVNRKDRRSRRLVSTPSGQKLMAEIDEVTDSALDEWLEDLTQDQLQSYLDTVKILASNSSKD